MSNTKKSKISDFFKKGREKGEKSAETTDAPAQPKSAERWIDSFAGQRKWIGQLLSILLTLIITIPIFCLMHRVLPSPNWNIPFDRIALFLALGTGLYFLFRKIRFFMLTLSVLLLCTLIVTSLIGKYSFKDVIMDYRGLIYSIQDEERSVKDLLTTKPFPKQKQILNAARITPKVKQYANKASLANFKKKIKKNAQYRTYIQCFSIFKEVKGKWQYVNDPHKWDYIASADETLESFAGDCDDYAILMASCLNAVGGTVRLVRTEDHIYPELKIENKADFDNISYLIRNELFKKEIKKKKYLNYHIDKQGHYWLNMDYTANYPGGDFHSGEVIAVLLIP